MRRGFRGLSLRQTTPVPPLQFVAQSIPLLRAGESYPAFKIEATGGRGPKLYEVVDPADLPPGMTMGEDGVFPSAILRDDAAGFWQAEIRVSAQGAAPISAIMTFDVAAKRLTIRVTPQPCPSAVIGSDYSGRVYLTVDGGDAVDDVSIFPGTGLPTGLSLTLVDQPTSLVIYEVTGTPTGGGGLTFIAVVVATSTDGQSVTVDLTIPVQAQQNPLTLTYPAASNAEVGAAYSALTPSTTGGTGTLTYSRTGAMPGGMAFNTSTGTFSTANVTGTAGSSYRSVVTVTDQSTPAKTATAVVVIVVNAASAPTITMTLPTFTDGVPGATYTKTATTANQTGTVSWALGVDDVLPPGITFSNGVWSGTFGYSGANQTYSGSVTATDSGSAGAITKSWSIRVGAVPASLQLTYPAFPTVATGAALSAVTPTRTGGVGPFVYSLAQGAFGLSINASTGAVSASALTAPAGFTLNDTVILVDQGASTGASSTQVPITIQMAVAAGPTITLTLPTFATAVPGQPYSAACTAGGTFAGNAVWDVAGIQGLPAGFSLVQSGVKNGTLTFTASAVGVNSANQIYSGTVKVTDSLDANNFAIKSWLINVAALPATFVAPFQTNTIPAVALTGATDETIDRVIASYWDDGDATDATYSIRQSSVSTYPVPAGVTLQMDGTDIGGTAQVVNGGIVNADIASSDNIRLEIVCDYTDPGTPVPGGDAEAAWANQAALSNLGVRCRFDTLTEVDAGGGDAPGLAHGPAYDEGRWGWDQGVRLSGAGSLRLEYWDTTGNPVGFGDGNGNNSVNWSHYLDGAGARRFYQVGDEVWLRFAARFNEAFIRQCPRTYGGTNPSTKVSIIDRFRGTAGNREVVITNSRARGVPAVYIGLSQSQAWTSGGGPVSTQSGVGSDYRLHPAYDAGTPNPATTTNEREQRYGLMYGTPNNDYVGPGVLGNVPDPDIGSFVFKPYVWHMFYQRIKITSEAGDQNGIYQLWAGDYGSNRVVNLISQTNVNYRINSPSSKPVNDKTPGNAGFSGFTLTPFQTDLNVDPGRLKVMTWYDEVLTRIGAGGFQHPGATGFITLPGIL